MSSVTTSQVERVERCAANTGASHLVAMQNLWFEAKQQLLFWDPFEFGHCWEWGIMVCKTGPVLDLSLSTGLPGGSLSGE